MSYGAATGLACAMAVLVSCSSSSEAKPTGTASVTVVDGSPLVDVPVVFHRPDGSVQAVVATDVNGTAAATIEEGSLVTVGRFFSSMPDQWRLTTIAGLEAGDALQLVEPQGFASAGQVAVSLSPAPSATAYEVDAGCSAARTTDPAAGAILPLHAGCGPSLDVLGVAFDVLAEPVAYAAALDVAVVATTANATLGSWQPLEYVSLAVTSAPAGSELVYATLEPRRNGARFASAGSADSAAILPAGSASLSVHYPPGFATSARRRVVVFFAEPGVGTSGTAHQIVNEATLTSTTLDLATVMPPRLKDLQLADASGTLVATWTHAAADPTLDATILSLRWAASDGQYDWEVLLPPGRTRFVFPALPAELSAFHRPGDAVLNAATVTSHDVSGTASYRGFKQAHTGLLRELPESGSYTLRSTSTW